jgi:transcriptional regulator with XRE-family HTH domain
LEKLINKTNVKVLGSIIKMNRMRQNMSQKALSEGICVNSYLSRIENAEIIPSEEVIHDLFNALAIHYQDSPEFIEQGLHDFKAFLDELMFNEFDQSHQRFVMIEAREEEYVHSPLIIDYFIIKLAYYCTQERAVFNETKSLLTSVKDLMTREQLFKFYLYMGIDTLKVAQDEKMALDQFFKASIHGENGHMYKWLGYALLALKRPIEAYKNFQKALKFYLNEGNLTSIIGAYEMIGLTHYVLNEYVAGIEAYETGLKYAKIINNDYNRINITNQVAWGYMRLGEYEKAMDLVIDDRYNSDLTVNASVTRFLIAFYTKDEQKLHQLQTDFVYRNKSFHRMIYSVLCRESYFDEKGNWCAEESEVRSLYEFASVTHFELKKAFSEILIDYLKLQRKYKEALEVMAERL